MRGLNQDSSGADADRDDYAADWHWVLRGVVVVGLAWILIKSVGSAQPRTIFAAIDLGIHEAGHLLFAPFGRFLMVAGGTILQLLVPLVVGVLFARRGDHFAACFAAAWLGVNLVEVAIYIGDARAQNLPLVTVGGGDALHDWTYLLSRMGCLGADRTIGAVVRGAGHLLHAGAVAAGLWIVVRQAARRRVHR
jgi:hypothetical protein